MQPDVNGILLVDKPQGPTSHDIVDRVRRHFRIKSVGHCGTLDPMATGLLILVLGKATRLSERFMGEDKEYEGTLKLGITTDSQDADGEVREEKPVPALTNEQIEAVFHEFHGDMMQTPPMHSAKKINGVPLYKLAHKGQEVDRPARLIHIYRFAPLQIALPCIDFRVMCTKGTYVRTLCYDLSIKLGCGGHLSRLRRTASGAFRVEQAHTLEAITGWNQSALQQQLLSPLQVVKNLPA